MTCITTFYVASSSLAAVLLSVNSASAGADKITVTAGANKQIQVQKGQGDPEQPYIIGGTYNGSGNGTPSAGPGKRQHKRAIPLK